MWKCFLSLKILKLRKYLEKFPYMTQYLQIFKKKPEVKSLNFLRVHDGVWNKFEHRLDVMLDTQFAHVKIHG